jgi:hypothetical protein
MEGQKMPSTLKVFTAGAVLLMVLLFNEGFSSARADISFSNVEQIGEELQLQPKEEAGSKEISEVKSEMQSMQTFQFRMGDRLKIKAAGEFHKNIAAALEKNTASNVLSLYFDGTKIPGIPVGVISSSNVETLFYFDLIRDADNDDSRKAWDALFRQKSSFLKSFQPSVSVGNQLPVAITSSGKFIFYVGTREKIVFTLVACLASFVAIYFYLVKRTVALRDSPPKGFYSLGKSQMAFWGLLVMLAFLGVWFVNGTLEIIPAQMLMLLGISGGTGLGAIVINDSKNTTRSQAILALQSEATSLNAVQPPLPAASQLRLTQIDVEITRLVQATTSSESFWTDICDDGNGMSFHRLQVVIWTLILGSVFIQSVVQVMSIPEFPNSLLILMGVSNVTYLGFKIPEK